MTKQAKLREWKRRAKQAEADLKGAWRALDSVRKELTATSDDLRAIIEGSRAICAECGGMSPCSNSALVGCRCGNRKP